MPASALAAENGIAVKKGLPQKSFNCRLEQFMVNVSVGGTCDKHWMSDIRRVTLWAITNTENIIRGSELLLQIPEPKQQTEPESKRQKCVHVSEHDKDFSAPAA